MEAVVRHELEHIEEMALDAGRANEQHREDAINAAATYASVALSTLLHVGLIAGPEEAAWRERLGLALGDKERLARRAYKITVNGARELSETDRAHMAYTACRDLSRTRLAWVHHTAATESAIADALAADASDPERIRQACKYGFADRGQEVVESRDL